MGEHLLFFRKAIYALIAFMTGKFRYLGLEKR